MNRKAVGSWAALSAALALSGCGVLEKAQTRQVSMDVISCVQPADQSADSPSCSRRKAIGSYKVTVTAEAGTCAVLGHIPLNAEGEIAGGRLAYIDDDNWQCEIKVNKGAARRFVLKDGTLSIEDVYGAEAVPLKVISLDRTDTLLGAVKHYLREMQN